MADADPKPNIYVRHGETLIRTLAVIGCGSMGGGMALLFAEHGCDIMLQDPQAAAMDQIIAQAKHDGITSAITAHADYASLCRDLLHPKVFVWSLPHGTVGDEVLDGLLPFLAKDDVIIDCANEHWRNTERRMGKCVVKGIRYVGMGVSGGYQAARRGPSMCPGSDTETMKLVLPFLRKAAAKAPDGSPCVAHIGTGGAGHYCKMIHNGIEHGMMSAICEAWGLMSRGLGMDADSIAAEFDRWNADGGLRDTFLIRIAADICRAKDPSTGARVLDTVEDKVVQDWTGEEGTGIWSNTEAIEHHVPAPTLATAHVLRIASGDLHQRRTIAQAFGHDAHFAPPTRLPPEITADPQPFLEALRTATYTTCLAAFVQGLHIIAHADRANHFNVHFPALLQIWRAGCIIQADHITSGYPALKHILVHALHADHPVPSLSATLEYLKYQTSTDLPTSFHEAQLDYFGKHMFDRQGEDPAGRPETGKHHFEWKPA